MEPVVRGAASSGGLGHPPVGTQGSVGVGAPGGPGKKAVGGEEASLLWSHTGPVCQSCPLLFKS